MIYSLVSCRKNERNILWYEAIVLCPTVNHSKHEQKPLCTTVSQKKILIVFFRQSFSILFIEDKKEFRKSRYRVGLLRRIEKDILLSVLLPYLLRNLFMSVKRLSDKYNVRLGVLSEYERLPKKVLIVVLDADNVTTVDQKASQKKYIYFLPDKVDFPKEKNKQSQDNNTYLYAISFRYSCSPNTTRYLGENLVENFKRKREKRDKAKFECNLEMNTTSAIACLIRKINFESIAIKIGGTYCSLNQWKSIIVCVMIHSASDKLHK
ncbi:hypothetical protein EDC96DRAFT_547005 [Choanephora cucurbitarum]|nr:hypothetical protein EDC96DRAFT_547005 [Choanephora cucurbitarum]